VGRKKRKNCFASGSNADGVAIRCDHGMGGIGIGTADDSRHDAAAQEGGKRHGHTCCSEMLTTNAVPSVRLLYVRVSASRALRASNPIEYAGMGALAEGAGPTTGNTKPMVYEAEARGPLLCMHPQGIPIA
jgi:hypothetical protein